MALQVEKLKRVFKIKKDGKEVILKDVNKNFTPEDTMQFYSTTHPELTTSTISGPEIVDDAAVYHFKTTVGDKA